MIQEYTASSQPPKLLDQVRERLRVKHYSIRTEQAYVDWIKRFIRFHGKRHPKGMGAPEVEAFLTHLAVKGKVSASTQNQAKSALLFLYREVLEQTLPWLDKVTQAKAPQRLPVVLTVAEVQAVLLYYADHKDASEAMGIDWMTRRELKDAIPPSYTEFIGHQLMQHIKANALDGPDHRGDDLCRCFHDGASGEGVGA